MRRAPSKSPTTTTAQTSSAVNVVCVDVNTLVRAALEKERRERILLDDRPILGRSADELLEEEMRANVNRQFDPAEDSENLPVRTDNEPRQPSMEVESQTAVASKDYFIKGCARDAMVFPPLSPADATILQEVLRNPEVTLAGGERVVSRPSSTARQAPFSSPSGITKAASASSNRPFSSASSTSTAAAGHRSSPEPFRVVPHIAERFRARRRSHVDLEPYTHPNTSSAAHHCGSVSSMHPARVSATQMFWEDAQPPLTSRTTTQLWRRPSRSSASHSNSSLHVGHRRSTQPMGPQSNLSASRPSPYASAVSTTGPSVSSSTVDCLAFRVTSPTVDHDLAHAAWCPQRDGVGAASSACEIDLGEGSAALAKHYLRAGAGAGSPMDKKAAMTASRVGDGTASAGLFAPPTTTATAVAAQRQRKSTASSQPWEPLPSVKPRTNVAAFQSTLHTAHAVTLQEEERRREELRQRQMLSKPLKKSSAQCTGNSQLATKRCVPAAFRQAVDLAETQPKSRRPKRQ